MVGKTLNARILITSKLSNSVKTTTDRAIKSQTRLGGIVKKVNAQMGHAKMARRYGRQLDVLKRKQRALGHSSKRLNAGIADLERRYQRARYAASGYGRTLDSLRTKQSALGRAAKSGRVRNLGAAGGAALGAGVFGEAANSRARSYLQTVINAKDGNAEAAVARSRRAARAFARNRHTIAKEKELYEVEYILNSAGLEEEASRAGARIGHKVATVTRGTSEDVGNVIGTVFKNFNTQFEGTTEQQMGQIGNILSHVQLKYKIKNFNQLGDGLKEATSTAKAMKIPMADMTTLMGILNDAGEEGSRGGTAFNAAFRNMSKAADEFGFALTRAQDGSLDVAQTIRDLNDATKNMNIDERAKALNKVFGDEGIKGIIPLLGRANSLSEAFAETTKKTKSDLLDTKYAIIAEDDLANMQRFKENIIGIGTGLGRALLPPLNFVLGGVNKFIGGLGAVIDRVPAVGMVLGVATTAVIGVGAALAATTTLTFAWNAALGLSASGGAIRTIGLLTKGLWGLAARALPAVIMGTRALGAALLMNPIGLLVTGIAVGAVLIIKYWKPISKFFKGLWSKIKPGVTRLWNLFKAFAKWSPLGVLSRGIGAGFKALGAIVRSPRTALTHTWDMFKAFAKWSPLGLVRTSWSGLPLIFKHVMDRAKALVGAAMNKIKSWIAEPIEKIKKLWDRIRGVGKAIRKAKADAKPVLNRPVITHTEPTANDNIVAANDDPKRKKFPPILAQQSARAQQSAPTVHMTFNISGVVDAESFVRQIRPVMKRLARQEFEERMYD